MAVGNPFSGKRKPEPDPESVLPDDAEEEDRVDAWNFMHMMALGIPADDASALVLNGHSWHEAEDLVDRGCSPLLIAEILG